MIYAVIDTNVLVAAAKSHKPYSSASQVLTLVFSGVIQMRNTLTLQTKYSMKYACL